MNTKERTPAENWLHKEPYTPGEIRRNIKLLRERLIKQELNRRAGNTSLCPEKQKETEK